MNDYQLAKKPAFFPFVTAEVFFEAEAAESAPMMDVDIDLDAELDDILSLA
jgi:hypothetical protein